MASTLPDSTLSRSRPADSLAAGGTGRQAQGDRLHQRPGRRRRAEPGDPAQQVARHEDGRGPCEDGRSRRRSLAGSGRQDRRRSSPPPRRRHSMQANRREAQGEAGGGHGGAYPLHDGDVTVREHADLRVGADLGQVTGQAGCPEGDDLRSVRRHPRGSGLGRRVTTAMPSDGSETRPTTAAELSTAPHHTTGTPASRCRRLSRLASRLHRETCRGSDSGTAVTRARFW